VRCAIRPCGLWTVAGVATWRLAALPERTGHKLRLVARMEALEGAAPMSIALAEAAHELSLEVSALRRWIRRAQIELVRDPADTRRRLLRSEDFARLRRQRETVAVPAERAEGTEPERSADLREALERVRDATSKQYGIVNEQLAVLFVQLNELAKRVTQLEAHVRRA
jgi:predicted site-specific integrase-resolvase